MKTLSFPLLFVLLLLASCGQDAASKEAETRVTASIRQLLGKDSTPYVQVLHIWYQSDVPNTIKLNPKTEGIYLTHAEILQEIAQREPALVAAPLVTEPQAQGIRRTYQKLVDESGANVRELTNLATSGTSMSEAEQLTYVSDLAEKETHQLALVKYYGQKTASIIAQKQQQANNKKLMRDMWGHE